MRKLLSRSVLISILIGALSFGALAESGLPSTSPQKVGLSVPRLERLNGAIDELIDQKRIPGAVTLIARNGKVAHVEAQGLMDVESGEAMRTDAIFRIYSMTKPIVSVAIMMLFEEGRLALNDPVAAYIPEFKDLRVYVAGPESTMETEPLARPITIHDLLTHTSGFTYENQGNTAIHELYRSNGIIPGGDELRWQSTDAAPVASLEEMSMALSQVPLLHQPGVRFSYGVSVDVLGYVVEKVSGQSLDEFLSTRIFDPLGMSDTGFYVPSEKWARFTAVYEHDDDGRIKLFKSARESRFTRPPSLLSGGAGLVSTVADYVRFCQMMLNGGALAGAQILSPKTIELMSQHNLPDDMTIFGRDGLGFGLGFAVVNDIAKTHMIGSNGTYSWSGAASTAFWIDPQEKLILVAMTQVINPKNFDFYDFLQPRVYQTIVE